MHLVLYTNGTYEEELALYDCESDNVIMSGDWYHDKIDEQFRGFIKCLLYFNIEYHLDRITLLPTHDRFKVLNFYDGRGE